MSNDQVNEKYGVKQLLFYRAIPPFAINVPTNNHKSFGCIDCGDRFVLESSYQDHINRKSLKISYNCRRCNSTSQRKIFYNRCNFLSHIRSHSFKTASINVSDLSIEPLPLSFFKYSSIINESSETQQQLQQIQPIATDNNSEMTPRTICVECNVDITLKGSPNEDRRSHYMKYSDEFHSCPVCLLTLPTICALKTHLRIHLKLEPFFCPECGVQLSNKVAKYPYNHHCEGFNMMRATIRLLCPLPKCRSRVFHPQHYKNHVKLDHMKKVFKCPYCVVACFSTATINKHLESHKTNLVSTFNNISIFYKCESCPGRLVLPNHLESHANSHENYKVYPCWTCGSRFEHIPDLIKHHLKEHIISDNNMTAEHIKSVLNTSLAESAKKKIYRVVKRCELCFRSFFYKCSYELINSLPNVCPYKCTPVSKTQSKSRSNPISSTHIKCPLCPSKISQDWKTVKKHFASDHKNHKCLDCRVTTTKLDSSTYNKSKRKINATPAKIRKVKKRPKVLLRDNNAKNAWKDNQAGPESHLICVKCQRKCESKEDLEKHIKDHRDPYMAYQCMECGECFVVKPSFSTHLLVKHGISNVDDYIKSKKCYNDDALIMCNETNEIESNNMPLEENQCKICREVFSDTEELEKHFRVHGMAFLLKNAQSKTSQCN